MNKSIRILVALVVAGTTQLFAQTSFSLGLGGPAGQEIQQNQFVFSNSGVTAIATAWSIDRNAISNGFVPSEVVQWSPGIGAKSPGEVITDTPYVPYYVDNQDYYDFVLFIFDNKVDITSVRVHPSSGTFDLDASYWLGNVNPNIDLTGDSMYLLPSQGFNSRINDDNATASNSPRTLSITSPAGGVNALLFAARINGDAEYDRFKISSVGGTTVPEPSASGLLLASLALAIARRRR